MATTGKRRAGAVAGIGALLLGLVAWRGGALDQLAPTEPTPLVRDAGADCVTFDHWFVTDEAGETVDVCLTPIAEGVEVQTIVEGETRPVGNGRVVIDGGDGTTTTTVEISANGGTEIVRDGDQPIRAERENRRTHRETRRERREERREQRRSERPTPVATAAPTAAPTEEAGARTALDAYGWACIDSEEARFLALINGLRADLGLGPLAAGLAMSQAADDHSRDMGDHRYFSHTYANGESWRDVAVAKFGAQLDAFRGENIAWGNETARATYGQWVNSPPHYDNMVNPNYTTIGIGRVYGAAPSPNLNGQAWTWTTNFSSVPAASMPPCDDVIR